MIDAAGEVENVYTYDPFGNELEVEETVENPFRFAGYFWDAFAELYYCTARWYVYGNYIDEPLMMHVADKFGGCWVKEMKKIDNAWVKNPSYKTVPSFLVSLVSKKFQ